SGVRAMATRRLTAGGGARQSRPLGARAGVGRSGPSPIRRSPNPEPAHPSHLPLRGKENAMLAKWHAVVCLAAGFIAGLLVAGTWTHDPAAGRALADQPAKAAELPRYSVSSYAAGVVGGGVVHGAYVIDVYSGDVFHVIGDAKPKSQGRVEKQ